MAAATIFQKLYLGAFKLLRGDVTPTAEEQTAYDGGAYFHGFSGDGSQTLQFDAILLTALAWALTEPTQPVFVFVPKTLEKWALDRTKDLALQAVRGDGNCKSAVQGALRRLKLEVRPWLLPSEPPAWVAFGFEKDAPILPTWANGKIS